MGKEHLSTHNQPWYKVKKHFRASSTSLQIGASVHITVSTQPHNALAFPLRSRHTRIPPHFPHRNGTPERHSLHQLLNRLHIHRQWPGRSRSIRRQSRRSHRDPFVVPRLMTFVMDQHRVTSTPRRPWATHPRPRRQIIVPQIHIIGIQQRSAQGERCRCLNRTKHGTALRRIDGLLAARVQ